MSRQAQGEQLKIFPTSNANSERKQNPTKMKDADEGACFIVRGSIITMTIQSHKQSFAAHTVGELTLNRSRTLESATQSFDIHGGKDSQAPLDRRQVGFTTRQLFFSPSCETRLSEVCSSRSGLEELELGAPSCAKECKTNSFTFSRRPKTRRHYLLVQMWKGMCCQLTFPNIT